MLYWLLLVILILTDQLTKLLFKGTHLGIINYQINYGAAFSILPGYRWLFIAIAIIVIVFVAFYYKNTRKKLPLILLLAGITGNLIDRLFLGYVRDFIDLKFWPVFNIADSLSFIAVILMAYYIIKKEI